MRFTITRLSAASRAWMVAMAVAALPLAAHGEPLASEKAVASDAFVDSIGIVTHFNYERTYRDNADKVVGLMADSGIRHIRDGFGDAKSRDILTQLATRGVKVDLVTNYRQALSQIVGYPALLKPGSVDAFEGPNELDLVLGGDAYIGILGSFMPALYHAVKSDPRTRSIAVIGPSLVTARNYAAAGDLSPYLDYGNLHNYVNGRNPGTQGWNGESHYGSTPFMMNAARKVSATKPIMTTETGYGTSSKAGEVNDATQLHYLMRAFFEQALNGIYRTYTYAFLDDGASTYNTYGIVRHDLSTKPSYVGLRNLIKLLSDSGTPRTDTLRYLIEAGPTIHHYLLEKSDGHFYLAIWNEAKIFSLAAGGDEREVSSPPVPTRITLAQAISGAKIFSFDRAGNMSSTAAHVAGQTIDLPIGDSVSIVEF